MQTATYDIATGNPGRIDYRRGRLSRHQPGSKSAEEKSVATRRKRNGFLSQKLGPIATEEYWYEEDDGTRTNLATRENFEYLYRSAMNYARLMNVELPFRYRKGGNPRIHISNLYQAMDLTFPEHINIEVVGGKPHFCVFRHHKWPDRELLWIPIDFAEKLSPSISVH